MSDLEARAEALFLEAGEQVPGARDAFLERAAAGDDALLARVRELLALERHMPGAFLSGDAAPAPTYLAPGTSFAGFQILRRIGEGGMGTVYAAQQSMPRREVALKVIRPGRMSSQAQRRFHHEVEVLGNLQHPGIAQIYEAGSARTLNQEGEALEQPYLAMELVRGEPLLRYARANALGREARLELMARLCDAIHHAHQRAVIHRDLKPDNVLVTGEESTGVGSDAEPGSGVGRPMVLDFGIARVLDRDAGETRADELLGTLSYMSPEQLEGTRGQVDVRSDVYSLGVILYQLLTDRLPIRIEDDDLPSALLRLRSEEPPVLESVDPTLRGDVSTIARKALEKDVKRRYQSAFELASDLRRCLRGDPIEARSDSALYLLRRRLRRHRLMLLVAGSVLVLLAGFAVVFALQAEENRLLAQQEAAARALADEDYGAALEAVDLLTEVGQRRLEDVPQADEARRELLNGALEFHLGLLDRHQDAAQRQRTWRSRLSVGRIQIDLGDLSAARDQARTLLEEGPWRGDPAAEAELHLDALLLLGASTRMLGDLEEAKDAFQRAIDVGRAHANPTHPGRDRRLARAQRFLALVLADQGEPEQAEALLVESLEDFRTGDGGWSQDPGDRAVLIDNLMRLGIVRSDLGQPERAREAHLASLELVRAYRDENPGDLDQRLNEARLYSNLGTCAADLGDFDGAIEYHAQAIEAGEGVLRDHPAVARHVDFLFVAHNNMFYAHYAKDEYEVALEHSTRAGELLERLVDLQPDSVPLLLQRMVHNLNAGALCTNLERGAQAVGLLETVLELSERVRTIAPTEANRPVVERHARINLAIAHLALGDPETALVALDRLEPITDEAQLTSALAVLQDIDARLEGTGSAASPTEVGQRLVRRARRAGFEAESEFLEALPTPQRSWFLP